GSIDTRRDNPEWYRGHVPSAAGIPLGRQGKVDEIAATCLFLVSDDGGFITGQTIHVNGGAGYYLRAAGPGPRGLKKHARKCGRKLGPAGSAPRVLPEHRSA